MLLNKQSSQKAKACTDSARHGLVVNTAPQHSKQQNSKSPYAPQHLGVCRMCPGVHAHLLSTHTKLPVLTEVLQSAVCLAVCSAKHQLETTAPPRLSAHFDTDSTKTSLNKRKGGRGRATVPKKGACIVAKTTFMKANCGGCIQEAGGTMHCCLSAIWAVPLQAVESINDATRQAPIIRQDHPLLEAAAYTPPATLQGYILHCALPKPTSTAAVLLRTQNHHKHGFCWTMQHSHHCSCYKRVACSCTKTPFKHLQPSPLYIGM